jgi:phospholipid transport system substrate-binding protein
MLPRRLVILTLSALALATSLLAAAAAQETDVRQRPANLRLVVSTRAAADPAEEARPFAASAKQESNPAQKAADPEQVVHRLHSALIEAMKGGRQMGAEGRYKLLAPVVDQSFDMNYVARLSLGSKWGDLSKRQREQFVQALQRYSIATYAAEFDSYNGGHFKLESVTRPQRGMETVSTRFSSKDSAKTHQFNYLLHETPRGWRIINVVVDGVSDLSLKRSQYTRIMQTEGFDALLSKLNASADRLVAGAGGERQAAMAGRPLAERGGSGPGAMDPGQPGGPAHQSPPKRAGHGRSSVSVHDSQPDAD